MAVIREARNSRTGSSSSNRMELLTQRAKKELVNTLQKNFQEEFPDATFLNDYIKNVRSKEDVEVLTSAAPEKWDFPFIVFSMAVFVDLIDFAELSGFAWFITVVIKVIFIAILWFWLLGKLNGLFRAGSKAAFKGSSSFAQQQLKTASKTYLRKYLSRRAVAIIIVNFIPVVSILASWAFFIFLAQKRHNKFVDAYIKSISAINLDVAKKK